MPAVARARTAGRRRALLKAALQAVQERGVDGLRVEDVARRAGVGKGTVYLYLGRREQIFRHLTRRLLAPLHMGRRRLTGNFVPAFLARLERLLRLVRSAGGSLAPALEVLSTPAGGRDTILPAELSRLSQIWGQELRAARERGDIAAGVDPEAAGSNLVAAVLAAAVQCTLCREPTPFFERQCVELMEMARARLLDPVKPGGSPGEYHPDVL